MNSEPKDTSTPEPQTRGQLIEEFIEAMGGDLDFEEANSEEYMRFHKELAIFGSDPQLETAVASVPLAENVSLLRSALLWLIEDEGNSVSCDQTSRQPIWRSRLPDSPTMDQRKSSARYLLNCLSKSLDAQTDPGIGNLLERFSVNPLQILEQPVSLQRQLLRALERTPDLSSHKPTNAPDLHS